MKWIIFIFAMSLNIYTIMWNFFGKNDDAMLVNLILDDNVCLHLIDYYKVLV